MKKLFAVMLLLCLALLQTSSPALGFSPPPLPPAQGPQVGVTAQTVTVGAATRVQVSMTDTPPESTDAQSRARTAGTARTTSRRIAVADWHKPGKST